MLPSRRAQSDLTRLPDCNNMAYYYRSPQSPRDDPQVPAYAHPLSPQRNPNRLSGGVASVAANASSMRGGLTRRFTTNELPTALSPIGQQRKAAAGDYSVSTDFVSLLNCTIRAVARGSQVKAEVALLFLRLWWAQKEMRLIQTKLRSLEYSAGKIALSKIWSSTGGESTNDRRGKSCSSAVGGAKLTVASEEVDSKSWDPARYDNIVVLGSTTTQRKLTTNNQSAGLLKLTPVSLPPFHWVNW